MLARGTTQCARLNGQRDLSCWPPVLIVAAGQVAAGQRGPHRGRVRDCGEGELVCSAPRLMTSRNLVPISLATAMPRPGNPRGYKGRPPPLPDTEAPATEKEFPVPVISFSYPIIRYAGPALPGD